MRIKKIVTRWKQQEINRWIDFNRYELRSIVHRHKPIYFLDECMFTVRSYMDRDYSRVNE